MTPSEILRKIVDTAQEHPAKANFVAVHRQLIGDARAALAAESESEGMQCMRCGAIYDGEGDINLCPSCRPPPVDNAHVAPGCEQFAVNPDSKSAMHSGGSGAPERQGIDVPVSTSNTQGKSGA
jgi:hypothetical protein